MYQFQPGGTLSDDAFYVERNADIELFTALINREYCYVLAPRQIGKSSLRVRCQKRLEDRGYVCSAIDLSTIGTDLSQDEWYASLLIEIADGLGLEDPSEYWRNHSELSSVSRFVHYFSSVVIEKISQYSIIFVDEIDVLRKLPFPGDDFLAAIRSLFNKRADNPEFADICFCLIGVAAPGELIEDTFKTPFNIGRHIPMEDFTLEQAIAFAPGLLPCVSGSEERAKEYIFEIMKWTAGHPYMTQRLCSEIARSDILDDDPTILVEQAVARIFGDALSDPNLSYAATRITSRESPISAISKLSLYRRILLEEQVESNRNDRAQSELRLAGLVKDISIDGRKLLTIRNVIFRRVFDLSWLNEHSLHSSISDAHLRWFNSAKSTGYLLYGQALDDALAWSEGKEISAGEQEFIRLSLLQKQQEIQERESQQDEKRQLAERRTKTLRIGISLLSLLAIGLLISMIYVIVFARRARQATEYATNSLKQERIAKENAEIQRERAENAQRAAQSAFDREAKQRMIAESALASEKAATEEATVAKNQALKMKDEAEAAQVQAMEAAVRAQEMQRRAEESAKTTAAAEDREEEARHHAVELADEIVTVLNSLLGPSRSTNVDSSLRGLIHKSTSLLDILKKQHSDSNEFRLLESHSYAHLKQGDEAISLKDIKKAREHYTEAVRSSKRLIKLDPFGERAYRTVCLAYVGLSGVAKIEGKIQERLELQFEILEIRQELYERNPRIGERMYNYLVSLIEFTKLLKQVPAQDIDQAVRRPFFRDPTRVLERLRTQTKRAVDKRLISKEQVAFIGRLTEKL